MKKLTLFLCGLLLATSAMAGRCRANDSWHGEDKQMHFGMGMAISGITTLHTADPWRGFRYGVYAGAGKELLDAVGLGDCSAQDFAVTVLGSAIGAYTGGLIVTRVQGRTMVAINIPLN